MKLIAARVPVRRTYREMFIDASLERHYKSHQRHSDRAGRAARPQTLFEDRVSRLDLRVSKVFKVGRLRVRGNVDAYNVLNANAVRSVLSTYGARWRTPTQILDPRLVEVGGTISF
jgi:hypothetical protein